MPESGPPRVILASGSVTRHRLLADAGVACMVEAPNVDEEECKIALRAEGATATEAAEALAELKALRISRKIPEALVIGSDQMLECDGRWFEKSTTIEEARATLLELRGRTHTLLSAVVVSRGGTRIWHHVSKATLTMRPFSDDFLDLYLESVGDGALSSVGAYHLEGVGAQLFSRVQGDYFTVLGLPLLPLLDTLRNHKVIGT